jgi:hypothetical protein
MDDHVYSTFPYYIVMSPIFFSTILCLFLVLKITSFAINAEVESPDMNPATMNVRSLSAFRVALGAYFLAYALMHRALIKH